MPDFLVIGAPKAGTTALHAALSEHPGLYMSAIKEPKFFLSDGPPPTKGGPGDALTYREHIWRRADYEALFAAAPPGTLRGESTPLYLYDRAAMRRIRDTLPQARLIVIVRDPVERAHSNWTHLWSAGLEPVDDFVRACAEEERRRAAGWASFWHYTGLGRYGEQLEYLFTLFPREQVLVLRYRRLVDEPAQTLDQICAFLGVPAGVLTQMPRHNVTSHPEPTLAHRAVAAAQRAGSAVGSLVPGLTAATLTGPLERYLQRHSRERQPLGWAQRQELLPRFEPDIELLERVLGEDFGDWMRPRERSGGMVGARPAGQGQAKNGRIRSLPAPSGCVPSSQLGDQRVRAVRPGHLVIEPVPPVWQRHDIQVPQAAAVVRGGCRRAIAQCGQRRQVGAGRHSGPFLIVLRRAGAPVIVGRHHSLAEVHRGDPGAPRVPPSRRPAQRRTVPGPGQAVRAGRVLGGHLVGMQRIHQWVAGRPQVPRALVAADYRVLDTGLVVAGQDHLPLTEIELPGMRRLGHLDAPVLGAGSCAAQIQPPAALRRADQSGALQRLAVEFLLPDGQQGLEALASRGPRDYHGVAAAPADGPPEPIREEDLPVTSHRARRPGPVSRPGPGRLHGYGATVQPGKQHQTDPFLSYSNQNDRQTDDNSRVPHVTPPR